MRLLLATWITLLLVACVVAAPVPNSARALDVRQPDSGAVAAPVKKRTLKQWNPRQQAAVTVTPNTPSKRAVADTAKPSGFVKH